MSTPTRRRATTTTAEVYPAPESIAHVPSDEVCIQFVECAEHEDLVLVTPTRHTPPCPSPTSSQATDTPSSSTSAQPPAVQRMTVNMSGLNTRPSLLPSPRDNLRLALLSPELDPLPASASERQSQVSAVVTQLSPVLRRCPYYIEAFLESMTSARHVLCRPHDAYEQVAAATEEMLPDASFNETMVPERAPSLKARPSVFEVFGDAIEAPPKVLSSAERTSVLRAYYPGYDWAGGAEKSIGGRSPRAGSEPVRHPACFRFLLEFLKLSFEVGNIQPLFCEVAMYDVATGEQLSECFSFEMNGDEMLSLLDVHMDAVPPSDRCTRALFELDKSLCTPSVRLVLRVYKVLQGDLKPIYDRYSKDLISERHMRNATTRIMADCNRLGRYRQLFVWSVSPPLFSDAGEPLDGVSFEQLYRPPSLTEGFTGERLCDAIANLRSQRVVPGSMLVNYHVLDEDRAAAISRIQGRVLSPFLSLVNEAPEVKRSRARRRSNSWGDVPPSALQGEPPALEEPSPSVIAPPVGRSDMVREVLNFARAERLATHDSYVNSLFVYPQSVAFPDARNVSVSVEFRCTDESADTPALPCIYAPGSCSAAAHSAVLPVTYHCKSPAWSEEVKVELPVHLRPRHHLLFTFYNVSCKRGASSMQPDPTTVLGYAMLPLLQDGRVVDEWYDLPVVPTLRPHYLLAAHQIRHRAKSAVFSVRLHLHSSIYTNDPFLNRFLLCADEVARPGGQSPPVSPRQARMISELRKRPGFGSAFKRLSRAGALTLGPEEDGGKAIAEEEREPEPHRRSSVRLEQALLEAIGDQDRRVSAFAKQQADDTIIPKLNLPQAEPDDAEEDEDEESDAVLASILGRVMREGQLCRQGGLTTAWKQRWYVLTPTHLMAYKDPNAVKPESTAALTATTSVAASVEQGEARLSIVGPQEGSGGSTSPAVLSPRSPRPAETAEPAAGDAAELVATTLLSRHGERDCQAWVKAFGHVQTREFSLLDAMRSLVHVGPQELVRHSTGVFNLLVTTMCATGLRDAHTLQAEALAAFLGACSTIESYVQQRSSRCSLLDDYVRFYFDDHHARSGRPHLRPRAFEQLAALWLALLKTPDRATVQQREQSRRYSWMLFDMVVKSMVIYRDEQRAWAEARGESRKRGALLSRPFETVLTSLVKEVTVCVLQGKAVLPSKQLNRNLALFVADLYAVIDNKLSAELVATYLRTMMMSETPTVLAHKSEFLQIVCDQHMYVARCSRTLLLVEGQGYFADDPPRARFGFKFKQMGNLLREGSTRRLTTAVVAEDDMDGFVAAPVPKKTRFLPMVLIKEVTRSFAYVGDDNVLARSALTLRNVLTKHAHDSRYQGVEERAYVASLYVALIPTLWQHRKVLEQIEKSDAQRDLLACVLFVLANVEPGPLREHLTSGAYEMHDDRAKHMQWFTLFLHTLSQIIDVFEYRGTDPSVADLSRTILCPSTALEPWKELGTFGGRKRGESAVTRKKSTVALAEPEAPASTGEAEGADAEPSGDDAVQPLSADGVRPTAGKAEKVTSLIAAIESRYKYANLKSAAPGAAVSALRSRRVSSVRPGMRSMRLRTATARDGSARSLRGGEGTTGAGVALDPRMRRWERVLANEVSHIVLDTLERVVLAFAEEEQLLVSNRIAQERLLDVLFKFLSTHQSNAVMARVFQLYSQLLSRHSSLLWRGISHHGLVDRATCSQWWFQLLRHGCFVDSAVKSCLCDFVYGVLSSKFDAAGSLSQVTSALIGAFADVQALLRESEAREPTRPHVRHTSTDLSRILGEDVQAANPYMTQTVGVRRAMAKAEKRRRAKERDAAPFDRAAALVDFSPFTRERAEQVGAQFMLFVQSLQARAQERLGVAGQSAHVVACAVQVTQMVAKMVELMRLSAVVEKNTRVSERAVAESCLRIVQLYEDAPRHQVHYLRLLSELHEAHGDAAEAAECLVRIVELVQAQWRSEKTQATPSRYWDERFFLHVIREASRLFGAAGFLEKQIAMEQMLVAHHEPRLFYAGVVAAQEKLLAIYRELGEIEAVGKVRMLGKYYRVAFFGRHFGELDGREFVYREPGLTQLSTISHRLSALYSELFGVPCKLIRDSKEVDASALDPEEPHVQVTSLEVYFRRGEEPHPKDLYRLNADVDTFYYDTPFTLSGKAHGSIAEQHKRRTILSTAERFPFVLRRQRVESREDYTLEPIECVIEDIHKRVKGLRHRISPADGKPTLKMLNQVLSGSVNMQVHGGAEEVCQVFLAPDEVGAYPEQQVRALKQALTEFVDVCGKGLHVAQTLIEPGDVEHLEFQEVLKGGYRQLISKIGKLLM